MDDSLEKDQLNLWDKLNRLYGDRPDEEEVQVEPPLQDTEPADEEVPVQEKSPLEETPDAQDEADTSASSELGSAALDEVDMVPPLPDDQENQDGQQGGINEVCQDCRYNCPQPERDFVISRCQLAMGSQRENSAVTPNQLVASQGSMGIEKINETCRRCRRSCKQRTAKLNMMLCLGFIPIDDNQQSGDLED